MSNIYINIHLIIKFSNFTIQLLSRQFFPVMWKLHFIIRWWQHHSVVRFTREMKWSLWVLQFLLFILLLLFKITWKFYEYKAYNKGSTVRLGPPKFHSSLQYIHLCPYSISISCLPLHGVKKPEGQYWREKQMSCSWEKIWISAICPLVDNVYVSMWFLALLWNWGQLGIHTHHTNKLGSKKHPMVSFKTDCRIWKLIHLSPILELIL